MPSPHPLKKRAMPKPKVPTASATLSGIEIFLYGLVVLLLFDLILAEMRMIPKNKHEETDIFSIWHLIVCWSCN